MYRNSIIICTMAVLGLLALVSCGGDVPDRTRETDVPNQSTTQMIPPNSSEEGYMTNETEIEPEFASADFFELLLNKKMYRSEHDWYNMALTSYYETPKQIDLGLFFYNGFPWLGKVKLTEEERAFLGNQPGFFLDMEIKRLSTTQMNEVLNQYFGVTMERTERRGMDNFIYYEKTDSYYFAHTDALLVHNITVTDVEIREDGIYLIHYFPDDISYCPAVVVMRYTDGDWQYISNLPA